MGNGEMFKRRARSCLARDTSRKSSDAYFSVHDKSLVFMESKNKRNCML